MPEIVFQEKLKLSIFAKLKQKKKKLGKEIKLNQNSHTISNSRPKKIFFWMRELRWLEFAMEH